MLYLAEAQSTEFTHSQHSPVKQGNSCKHFCGKLHCVGKYPPIQEIYMLISHTDDGFNFAGVIMLEKEGIV